MAEECMDILPKLNELTPILINNEIFDEESLLELINDIDENDNSAKLERIIGTMETRDPEQIDKFAILLRESGLIKEELLSTKDECDSILKDAKHVLLVRFKDLLSSPKACGEEITVKKAKKIKGTNDGDVYKMISSPRGFCIIIDNQLFTDPELGFRAGSRADADRLSEVFTQLGFRVFRYVNKTVAQIEILLQNLSTNPELYNHDALSVIILSHGIADSIYGSDGDLIRVESILSYFNNRNCSLMINKPKMFFLSACRGDEIDSGTEIYELDVLGGGRLSGSYLSRPQSLSGSLKRQVPTWSDVFVYFSSVSGYASIRNTQTGSWFGYELAHSLAQFACKEHLHDLVTIRVGQRLQERETQSNGILVKQAIETTTRGSVKKLYFNPGF